MIVDFTSNNTWLCPSGVFTTKVESTGRAGGGGGGVNGGGGGGGGGGYSRKNTLSVTPGVNYTIVVDGTGSYFDSGGDCLANVGTAGGLVTGGLGGPVGIGDVIYAGGDGGDGGSNPGDGGGGGGSSAGSTGAGVNGSNASGATGGAGGVAPTDGGNGGVGGNNGVDGIIGSVPGGGAGGGGDGANGGGNAAGRVRLTFGSGSTSIFPCCC